MDYKRIVGNVELVSLTDGQGGGRPTGIFPSSTVETWRNEYPELLDADGLIHPRYGSVAVRSGGKLVIVDTGAGPPNGALMDDMASKGVDREAVDLVVLTHLHPDHVGWNINNDGASPVPAFPKARYVFHKDDWEAFRPPRDSEIFGLTFWEETLAPLEAAGVIEPLSGEHSITSEIKAILTPGHTPGSMSLSLTSHTVE